MVKRICRCVPEAYHRQGREIYVSPILLVENIVYWQRETAGKAHSLHIGYRAAERHVQECHVYSVHKPPIIHIRENRTSTSS